MCTYVRKKIVYEKFRIHSYTFVYLYVSYENELRTYVQIQNRTEQKLTYVQNVLRGQWTPLREMEINDHTKPNKS